MSFGELPTAQAMRDVIREFVKSDIEATRPAPVYATVQTIDRPNKKCTVLFEGDDEVPVTVRMYTIQPGAVGDVVRIEGFAGNRYVAEAVTGTAALAGVSTSFSPGSYRLDQFAAPNVSLSMGGQKIINLGTPTTGTDAATKAYADLKAPLSHSHAIADLPVATSGTSSSTQLVRADDSRLADARTPLTHTHDAAAIITGTVALARLPVATSGTSSATLLVRADDSRLSDARTPVAHVHAGADITTGTVDIARLPVATSGTSNTTQLVRADDTRLSNARTPVTHSHAIADLPVATSGTSSSTQLVRADDSRLSNARTPVTHSHTLTDLPVAASGVSSSTQLVRADDARLSDARTPLSHTHPSTQVSDFTEAVEDAVAALFSRSTMTGIAWTYDDTGATLSASVTSVSGFGGEDAVDAVAAAMVGDNNKISVQYDDPGNTITVSRLKPTLDISKYKGAWANGAYTAGDVVTYNGSIYELQSTIAGATFRDIELVASVDNAGYSPPYQAGDTGFQIPTNIKTGDIMVMMASTFGAGAGGTVPALWFPHSTPTLRDSSTNSDSSGNTDAHALYTVALDERDAGQTAIAIKGTGGETSNTAFVVVSYRIYRYANYLGIRESIDSAAVVLPTTGSFTPTAGTNLVVVQAGYHRGTNSAVTGATAGGNIVRESQGTFSLKTMLQGEIDWVSGAVTGTWTLAPTQTVNDSSWAVYATYLQKSNTPDNPELSSAWVKKSFQDLVGAYDSVSPPSYNADETYLQGDIVRAEGVDYIAIKDAPSGLHGSNANDIDLIAQYSMDSTASVVAVSFTVPSGVIKEGDLLLAFVSAGTDITGFTNLSTTDGNTRVCYKYATSGDEAGGTYSTSGTSTTARGILKVYRGASVTAGAFGYTAVTAVSKTSASAATLTIGSGLILPNQRVSVWVKGTDSGAGNTGSARWWPIVQNTLGIKGSLLTTLPDNAGIATLQHLAIDLAPQAVAPTTITGFFSRDHSASVTQTHASPQMQAFAVSLKAAVASTLSSTYWMILPEQPTPAVSLLSRVTRTSATPGGSSYSTSSNTAVDVDATNLAITFTTPPSGSVRVILSGVTGGAASGAVMQWSLREGTTNIPGSEVGNSGTTTSVRVTAEILLTGLSAGSHTYKWAWRRPGVGTNALYYGGTEFDSFSGVNNGPLVMEVWSA